ncbi:MAG: sulfatase-like hydrolase/transferase, partial [Chloroflexota bacterium]
ENGSIVTYDDRVNDYATDVSARHASEFIRQAADDAIPFFAYLPLRAPHEPAQPAMQDLDAFDGAIAPRTPAFDEADVSDKPVWIQRTPPATPEKLAATDAFQRERLRTLLAVDRAIATVLAALGETGQLASTYVFFTSDNGYHLGEHRQQLEKGTPYEESIRVPLVVRGPGVPAGTIEPRMASGADLAPTIADLAGAAVPSFVDGRSLAPLLAAEDGPWRDAVLAETWRDPASLVYVEGALQYRTPPDLAAEDEEEREDNPNQPAWRALRTETEVYAEYASGEREFYDLAADPWQQDNLASTLAPARLAQLSAQLDALVACAGDACRTADSPDDPARENPPPVPVIRSPQPFFALSWDAPIELEGAAWDGRGEPLPGDALSWDVVLHSARGERARGRPLTGSRLEINPAKLPQNRRGFKDAWMEIALTATDGSGRSRTTSIAYGLATPPEGIPGRRDNESSKRATPVPRR